MATVSPQLSIPLPISTDTDQVPADLMTAFTAAEKTFVGQFANASARDAKITSPLQGQLCELISPGGIYRYSGATLGWVALVQARRALNSGALIGTVWDGKSPLIDLETTVVVTPSGANYSFTYASLPTPPGFSGPPSFPNGIMYMSATAGDIASNLGVCVVNLSGSSLTTFAGTAYTPTGTQINAAAVRINVRVVGW